MNFPSKSVNWEVVRNVANRLTNQLLYLAIGGVNVKQAHISAGWAPNGVIRKFELAEGKTGIWRDGGDGGWWAFEEEDLEELYWKSASSGSALRATKMVNGVWELEYIPPSTDPSYRGNYFGFYADPWGIENLPEEYIRQTGEYEAA